MARSSSSGVGTLVGGLLVIGLLALVAYWAVAWPYELGARIAEGFGAADPSGARSTLGWIFELTYLLLLVGGLVWWAVRRANSAPEVPELDHATAKQVLAVMDGRQAGWSDPRIPAGEKVLAVLGGATLVEPRSRNGHKVPTRIAQGDLLITTKNARFLAGDRKRVWKWAAVTGLTDTRDHLQIEVSTRALDCGVAFPAATDAAGRALTAWCAEQGTGADTAALTRLRNELVERIKQVQQAGAAAAEHPGPPSLPARARLGIAASVASVLVLSTVVTGVAVQVSPEPPAVVAAAAGKEAPADTDDGEPEDGAPEGPATAEKDAEPTAAEPSSDATVLAGSGAGEDVDPAVEIKAARKGTALATIADLAVKGRAPQTGYDRDEFGPAWADVDRNGCDTRNDILARDLTDETFKAGTHDCVVLTGNLADPFTATAIAFQRGQSTSTAVQIDHVVALSDAWQKGAQQIDEEARRQFANDPLNLLAVDGPANAAKGDGDAATWLPSNKAFRCQYVARQIAVKKTYRLWVTQAEKKAMKRVLSSCPDEPLPRGGLKPKVEAVAVVQEEAAEPEAEVEVAPPSDDGAGSAAYYENCTAAKAAGAAPVRVGDPGYGTHLDRDRDGVGCES